MAGLSVRLYPVGRAAVISPKDQTPILELIENHRPLITLTSRHIDEVSDEEMEAARSLLAALHVFVRECERWTVPAALQNGPKAGGAA